MKNTWLVLVLVFLSACSTSHNIYVNKISKIEVSYFENNNFVNSLEFKGKAIELVKIKEWLRNNRDGWDVFIATPAAEQYIVAGEGFKIYVNNSLVILNYDQGSGEYRQLSKSKTLEEFSFLGELSHNKSLKSGMPESGAP